MTTRNRHKMILKTKNTKKKTQQLSKRPLNDHKKIKDHTERSQS